MTQYALRAFAGVFAIFAIFAMWGCQPSTPVTIELNFPSMTTFLYAEIARIQVFELTEEQIGECPHIIGRAMGGTPARDAYLDSGEVPVCNLRSGGVSFESIDEGPMAYSALVWDASNSLLLTGCTVAEVFEEAPPITVSLHMSTQYSDAVLRINNSDGPLYANEREKCEGGQ